MESKIGFEKKKIIPKAAKRNGIWDVPVLDIIRFRVIHPISGYLIGMVFDEVFVEHRGIVFVFFSKVAAD